MSNISNDPIDKNALLSDGAGKAYQSVAQSTAMAIQDAVDNLRSVNTISATALAVALAQLLENPQANPQPAIDAALDASRKAAENFNAFHSEMTCRLDKLPVTARSMSIQENLDVIYSEGDAPPAENAAASPTMEMLSTVLTQALGMAMHNAVTAQREAQIASAAATITACRRLLTTAGIGLPAIPETHNSN